MSQQQAGVMATDNKGILLLRRAPGTPHPELWELPRGLVQDGEPPEQTAERVLREQAGVAGDLADYVGYVDYPAAEGTVRQLVFTARVGMSDISLSGPRSGPCHQPQSNSE
ncbi:NUDIX hydrolase [Nonomuraea sp. AD125B]|uniref:NUDIX hydrolase n=1 Tax=Nonomuraea sp. AD125B TaxID=3242897 RepID=UPI0035283C28